MMSNCHNNPTKNSPYSRFHFATSLATEQEELSVGSKSHNTNRLKYVAVPKKALVSLGHSQFIILSLGSVNRCNWTVSLEYDYGRKFRYFNRINNRRTFEIPKRRNLSKKYIGKKV